MKKFTFLLLLLCTMFISSAMAQVNQTVVFDFVVNEAGIPDMANTTNFAGVKSATEYTFDGQTIKIDPTANGGSFYYDNCLVLGKSGSKIVLPAFSFPVEKIELVGNSSKGSSYVNVDMNVYVGTTAVSTATIGTVETYTYAIAEEFQAAGNVYEMVIGSNGGKYSSVMCISAIKVYPKAEEGKLTVEAPAFDKEAGVYTEPVTVTAKSASADVEGVTDVVYYYTTDGNNPTAEDEESTDGKITINESCTLKVAVSFKYEGTEYTSEATEAEYIISKAVTYEKAETFAEGNYFIVADGKIATINKDGVLPAKAGTETTETTITDAAYYTYTIESVDTDNGSILCIRDSEGNYLYFDAMSSTPKLAAHKNPAHCNVDIVIEDGVAKISANGYYLVYDSANEAFTIATSTEGATLPALYTVKKPALTTQLINPGIGAEVSEFDQLMVVFTAPVEVTLPEAGINVYNANNEVVLTLNSAQYTPGIISPVYFASKDSIEDADEASGFKYINKKITDAGTYKITIPAGVVKSNDGVEYAGGEFTFTIPDKLVPTHIYPSQNDTIQVLSDLTLNFAKSVKVDFPKDGINIYNDAEEIVTKIDTCIIYDYTNFGGNVQVRFEFEPIDTIVDIKDDKEEIQIIRKHILESGFYTFEIPAGMIKDAEGVEYEGGFFSYQVEKPNATTYIFPASESTLREIDKVSIYISNALTVAFDKAKEVKLYDQSGTEFTGTTKLSGYNGQYTLEISFGEKVIEEDTYTVFIPAGFLTIDGVANPEDIRLTYTVQQAPPLALDSNSKITPEVGKLGEITRITITFNQKVTLSHKNDQLITVYLTNQDGDSIPLTNIYEVDPDKNWAQVTPDNVIQLGFGEYTPESYMCLFKDSPYTEPGTYTLNLADVIVDYNYDSSTYQYNSTGFVEGTYTWTIGEGGNEGEGEGGDDTEESIDGIEADKAEQVIYDLTGRRIEKITEPGIYIINGVKKVVK